MACCAGLKEKGCMRGNRSKEKKRMIGAKVRNKERRVQTLQPEKGARSS